MGLSTMATSTAALTTAQCTSGDPAGELAALRAELAASKAALVTAQAATRSTKKGRTYYAGAVLALNPTAAIDATLAHAVCVACGKPNPTESLAWLKIAAQIVAGYNSVAK